MKNLKHAGIGLGGIVLAAGLLGFPLRTKLVAAAPAASANPRTQTHSASTSKSEAPSSDKILQFVRDKFGVVSTVKLTMGPLEPSPSPDYYKTVVTIDDGKQPRQQALSISKNGRLLLVGDLVALNGDVDGAVAQAVREAFKIPTSVNLTVTGALHPSKYPGFLSVTVMANDAVHPSQSQEFLVTDDKKYLNLGGMVYALNVDPRKQALSVMTVRDLPTQGPAHAPVTIVEFADLECPSCARMHQFLEDQLVPKYGDKVRVVFKEFPLVKIHQWAETAAIANECAYQIDSSKFVPYRTLIFQHQNDIDAAQANASQVRELLMSYGQQVGLDGAKLASCVDTPGGAKARVEQGMHEGEELSVNSTPTFYINGRFQGAAAPEIFFQAVDDAMKDGK
ncbi:MAG TPA: thioredoxin domain-containing protein [Terriglobia bacterium]|nr:thioredoxin domain-containing protein [Terriglobia bacterium]